MTLNCVISETLSRHSSTQTYRTEQNSKKRSLNYNAKSSRDHKKLFPLYLFCWATSNKKKIDFSSELLKEETFTWRNNYNAMYYNHKRNKLMHLAMDNGFQYTLRTDNL